MYIHVHGYVCFAHTVCTYMCIYVYAECRGFKSHPRQLIFRMFMYAELQPDGPVCRSGG